MERNLTLSNFEAFKREALDTLNTTAVFLDVPITQNPNELSDSLAQVESFGSRISYLHAKGDAYLDIAEAQLLEPKQQGVTEFDRETRLKAAVAEYRMLRDMLKNQGEAIKNRLMLGMTSLTIVRAEIERGIGR